jgi:succinate dehydrogenase/fumarate reductase cytochrome b subunit
VEVWQLGVFPEGSKQGCPEVSSMKKQFLALVFLAFFVVQPVVLAADFNQTISAEDQEAFDQILSPVMKIYNFIKYAATVLAVVFLVFAGVTFIMSGNDQAKREQAKMTAMYVVIGLMIIWVAPLVVQYLT